MSEKSEDGVEVKNHAVIYYYDEHYGHGGRKKRSVRARSVFSTRSEALDFATTIRDPDNPPRIELTGDPPSNPGWDLRLIRDLLELDSIPESGPALVFGCEAEIIVEMAPGYSGVDGRDLLSRVVVDLASPVARRFSIKCDCTDKTLKRRIEEMCVKIREAVFQKNIEAAGRYRSIAFDGSVVESMAYGLSVEEIELLRVDIKRENARSIVKGEDRPGALRWAWGKLHAAWWEEFENDLPEKAVSLIRRRRDMTINVGCLHHLVERIWGTVLAKTGLPKIREARGVAARPERIREKDSPWIGGFRSTQPRRRIEESHTVRFRSPSVELFDKGASAYVEVFEWESSQ